MTSVLDTAERVDPVDRLVYQQSPPSGGPIFTRRITKRVPERYRLRWDNASEYRKKALQVHYAKYGRGGAFDFFRCNGQQLLCQYVPGTVRWSQTTGNRYQIELTLETVVQ